MPPPGRPNRPTYVSLTGQLCCRAAIYELPLRSRSMEGMMLGGKEVAKLIALAPELQGAAKQLIRFELA